MPAAIRSEVFTRLALGSLGPLDLRLIGRTLLHAALVGAACGVAGLVLFLGVDAMQTLLLEHLCGYQPLRAAGEQLARPAHPTPFRPWLLWLMPAVGALAGGLISILVPETRGGGTDATIDAFHQRGGVVQRRVIFGKTLASIVTLGAGGSGGREGPTIQIGGAIGSFVGRTLSVSSREQRILLLAGAAAGISAVFRTPLGAALLAVEMVYRDDFESDALVPAVLASVVSYSVIISVVSGESTLFAHAARYPFVPAHLPLYALMVLVVSLAAMLFVRTMNSVKAASQKLPMPPWARPAVGGLALGLMATGIIVAMRRFVDDSGQGFGILSGGYGAAQVAITGASWLPSGWEGVGVLALLGTVKIVATSLTVGTGGSAGDFGPSLVIGALFGGAFGRAAHLLLSDPRIDPGAFALVGMGAFYGGVARAPLSSLVMVCEMAGSYDLLVPLMLAEGVAYVALRNHTIYHAQVPARRDSPAHRGEITIDALAGVHVGDVMSHGRPDVCFAPATPGVEVLRRLAEAPTQEVFPVLAPDDTVVGLIDPHVARSLASEREAAPFMVAADLMVSPQGIGPDEPLALAIERLLAGNLRAIPVLDPTGRILGCLDESDVTRAYVEALHRKSTV